jgi:Mannosyltransferase putative
MGRGKRFLTSSRLMKTVVVLLAGTIAVHHLFLTSHQLYNVTVLSGDAHEDDPVLPTNRQFIGENKVQEINLDSLSSHIGHSSQLSAEEKEQLLRTIQQLAEDKQQQQQEQLQQQPEESTAAHAFQLTPKSRYAYMFVIGGIHEDRPNYMGFFYDVLVSARLLNQMNSTADVVLFTQMSPDSKLDQLPPQDMQYLNALNVQVLTLPKPTQESFAGLVFAKFRALQLTQYRRVIFMDADAIPLANLDYLFHLSDPLHTTTPTLIRPNLVMASRGEPCNAGLFMLQPEKGAWDELLAIIRRQREEGKKLPYPHFSWERGWGYDFQAEHDMWRATVKLGEKWRYHAAHSDQGLLYYWVKYYKRDVSIVVQDEVENWIDAGPNANRTVDDKPKPMLQMTLKLEPLAPYSQEYPLAYQFDCDQEAIIHRPKANKSHRCLVPYRDFAHFMGSSKPWMKIDSPRHFLQRPPKSVEYNAGMYVWFQTLGELNTMLDMKLDFDKWHETLDVKESPLGLVAKFSDIANADHGVLQTGDGVATVEEMEDKEETEEGEDKGEAKEVEDKEWAKEETEEGEDKEEANEVEHQEEAKEVEDNEWAKEVEEVQVKEESKA